MAKKSRQFSTSEFTLEQVASNTTLKKAYEEALAEEAKLAAEKKQAASERRKEQKAIRDAERQANKEALEEAKENKKASNKSNTAAKEKQKKVEKQNRLENVTKRLSAVDRVEGVVSGTAKNIVRTVTSNITGGLGFRNFTPRAVAANTLQAAGLGSLVSLGPLFGGGKPSKPQDNKPTVGLDIAPLIVGFKALEVKLDNINNSIINSNEYLQDLIAGQSGAARERIEAERERRANITPRNEGVSAQESKGGLLSTLSGLLPSLGSLRSIIPTLTGLSGLFTGLIRFAGSIGGTVRFLSTQVASATRFITPVLISLASSLGGLLRFVLRIGGPIAILASTLLSLEQKDWSEILGNLSKVFDDLAQGKFLDAITRFIGTIGDTLITGVGRLVADVLEFFGFEDTANTINEFLDNMDLATTLVNTVTNIKDAIVNAFITAKDIVVDWWSNFSLSDTLTSAFESIKTKILDFVGEENLQKIYDVLSFDVGGYIAGKLGEVVDKIKNMFTDIINVIGEYLYEKGKLFEKIGLSNPFEGFKQQPTQAQTVTPQSSFTSLAAAGPAVPLSAQTTVEEIAPAYDETGFGPRYTQAKETFTPLVNTKNISMVAQSGWSAMAAAGAPKIIVVPGSGTMNNSREPSTPPRISSGAVSTAPAPSLMDQSLYGFGPNYY